MQRLYTAILRRKTSLRKDASKQANYEEQAYDEKTTIYTKTALIIEQTADYMWGIKPHDCKHFIHFSFKKSKRSAKNYLADLAY
jgi:hypothetical protein